MKLKLLISSVYLVFVCVLTATSAEPKTYTAALSDFINSHLNSDAKKLNTVLRDDASFKIPRQDKVIVQTKGDLVKAMRQNDGLVQNCTSAYQLLAKSDAIVIARVDFKYPEFIQQNFVTLEKGEQGEWKITQVCKISENKQERTSYPVMNTVY